MGDHRLGCITKLNKRKTLMETLRSRKEKGKYPGSVSFLCTIFCEGVPFTCIEYNCCTLNNHNYERVLRPLESSPDCKDLLRFSWYIRKACYHA